MIKDNRLKHDFSDCTAREKEILEKYWESNEKGDFMHMLTLKQIQTKYGIGESPLYTLANKYPLIWDFGKCNCGNRIYARLDKRTELTSCIKGHGAINTYKSVEYFYKCEECHTIEEQEKERQLYEGVDLFYDLIDESKNQPLNTEE